MLYNQVDPQGNIVKYGVALKPDTPDLPDGHRWVAVEEPLDRQKLLSIQKVKDIRDTLTVTGGYKVDTKWFHSDTFSRSQQLGLVLLGNDIPSNLQWKTMDGSYITMTPTLARQVFAAAAAQDVALFAYAESLINKIEQSEPVDLTSGWPETFR